MVDRDKVKVDIILDSDHGSSSSSLDRGFETIQGHLRVQILCSSLSFQSMKVQLQGNYKCYADDESDLNLELAVKTYSCQFLPASEPQDSQNYVPAPPHPYTFHIFRYYGDRRRILEYGFHTFPFHLELNKTAIPSTMESPLCCIAYKLVANFKMNSDNYQDMERAVAEKNVKIRGHLPIGSNRSPSITTATPVRAKNRGKGGGPDLDCEGNSHANSPTNPHPNPHPHVANANANAAKTPTKSKCPQSPSRRPNIKVSLQQKKAEFVCGEFLEFEVCVENLLPSFELCDLSQSSVSLVHKITNFQLTSSSKAGGGKTVSKNLMNSSCRGDSIKFFKWIPQHKKKYRELSWADGFRIPREVPPSFTLFNGALKLMDIKYVLQFLVKLEGIGMFKGQREITVGTVHSANLPRIRIRPLNLETLHDSGQVQGQGCRRSTWSLGRAAKDSPPGYNDSGSSNQNRRQSCDGLPNYEDACAQ